MQQFLRIRPLVTATLAIALGLTALALPAHSDYDRSRVVSIGGSVTEILYALGLEAAIVGVDTTSLYPPAALATHPNVGYMRALSAEGVLSLSPTLILTEADAGPKEALTVLSKASVPLVSLPDDATAQGLADKIRAVGAAMAAQSQANKLANAVSQDLEQVRKATAGIGKAVSVLFILTASGGRIVAAGTDTTAHAMIELAGGRNAFAAAEGYKPASPEALLEGAPDVILTMDRPGHEATLKELMAHPALAGTPAVKNHRVLTMDGLYLLGFGPRTAHAVRDLAQALYPDRTLPELPARAWVGERPPIKTSGP